MFDVAGVGASAVDLVYVLPAYPQADGPHSKLRIQSHTVSAGGQTATAMAGCAALGLRAAFMGVTGNDTNGALVRAELARRGVDISHTVTADAPQAYSVILLADGQPERIVLWQRQPGIFNPVDYSRLKVLHVDDVDIAVSIEAARGAREAGRIVTTDIDQVGERAKELLALATHPIVAEHVPAAITGEADMTRALRQLRGVTASPIIVTLGARGAMALDGDRVIEAPGFQVAAVDTTGAGDVFRAGFITALLEARPLEDAMRFANAAAAVSCTRRGAMASVPSRAEVEAQLSA